VAFVGAARIAAADVFELVAAAVVVVLVSAEVGRTAEDGEDLDEEEA
jgi:hypothetical protein